MAPKSKYNVMVDAAIKALNLPRKASNVTAITRYIMRTYNGISTSVAFVRMQVKLAIKRGLKTGSLKRKRPGSGVYLLTKKGRKIRRRSVTPARKVAKKAGRRRRRRKSPSRARSPSRSPSPVASRTRSRTRSRSRSQSHKRAAAARRRRQARSRSRSRSYSPVRRRKSTKSKRRRSRSRSRRAAATARRRSRSRLRKVRKMLKSSVRY
uniref:Sperm-specific H1/protamine-like protein type 1 n=1 Tax=Cerebratulus lacteus TaxID=6221 RepID=M4Y739_CERLA|nr:sperm-specific H1/protamine-like protein type 1 [Cerebratulus lacteus]